MKVELLRLIEDALVGGRNGEMAYIEHNPFIAQLFREYVNSNKGKNFKDFLKDCIEEDIPNRIIVKNIKIVESSEEYKEYIKAQREVNVANKNLEEKKKELAKSLDDVLYKISSFEIKHHEYWSSMEFKIFTSQLKE